MAAAAVATGSGQTQAMQVAALNLQHESTLSDPQGGSA